MATGRLTQRHIDNLKPGKTTRDIRDKELKGFGVRVLPSGHRSVFLHRQIDGQRVWHAIGNADDITLKCARSKATWLLKSRQHRDDSVVADQVPFEIVAEEVFRRYSRHWKPSTLEVNRKYLRNKILPWFKGRAIADITRSDIQQWFASLHATPVAADRSAPVLSIILKQAEVYG
ncbi:MAG: integrase arm-type DNA-binding domain-containing protein [Alphaproteobacteria bacterium]|nr:integrase arm-type DNA-binding domain-containing protein [Alphaproteobacteria bacterium]